MVLSRVLPWLMSYVRDNHCLLDSVRIAALATATLLCKVGFVWWDSHSLSDAAGSTQISFGHDTSLPDLPARSREMKSGWRGGRPSTPVTHDNEPHM
jgi:hypothetical protein